MKNVILTSRSRERKILVNWDNVHFAKMASDHFGDEYVEVHFAGNKSLDVSETLEEIERNLT